MCSEKKFGKGKKKLDNKKLVFILLQKVLWKTGMKRYNTTRLLINPVGKLKNGKLGTVKICKIFLRLCFLQNLIKI